MDEPIETMNDSLVCVGVGGIRIMRPRAMLSKAEALRLAAWIVALADDDNTFAALLDAVQNT